MTKIILLAWSFLTAGVQLSEADSPNSQQAARIEFVEPHPVNGLSKFALAFQHKASQCVFSSTGSAWHCVHPTERGGQGGELCTYTLKDSHVICVAIPQPKNFVPRWEFKYYFDNAAVWVNSQGDLLIRWDLEGNGDHGLAFLKKDSSVFITTRTKVAPMENSWAVAAPDGTWYLLVWSASLPQGFEISAFRVDIDSELHLTSVGTHKGDGHHDTEILDARFVSQDLLHLFWAAVLPPPKTPNYLRMRSMNFDVQKQTWSAEQEIYRLDSFVGSATGPAVIVLKDKSYHYFWKIDEGYTKTGATGLYYRAGIAGKPVKIAQSYDGFQATSLGTKIVTCYTLREHPDKVFFHVIQDGSLGPPITLTLIEPRDHNLWGDSMVLGAEANVVWFMNTLSIDTLYELRIVPAQ